MERPKRGASKVSDYRQYHLSGDLEEVVQGKVSEAIVKLEQTLDEPTMSSEEETQNMELLAAAREQKEKSHKMQLQVENMKLRNEIEAEKLQQEQWEAAMQHLKNTREKMLEQHTRNMDQMKNISQTTIDRQSAKAVHWLQKELDSQEGLEPQKSEQEEAEAEKARLLEDLHRQQEQLQRQISEVTQAAPRMGWGCGPTQEAQTETRTCDQQELLMGQLRTALAPKGEDKDPNKAILKALLTSSNKTVGPSGTSTLKADILSKLTGEGEFSMAEWLASLNKQEEGESDALKYLSKEDDVDCRSDCKHAKFRSGMLDKSTTNIRHKEVWPQKNLGEDWAEEEMEFKQLKFEHLVAGETRTIETCTDPAQILGRLRLLRRIAYLKLRGIDWQLLRKMYAAILSSIETREYSWESNFDRFESILYRKVLTERHTDKDREHKPTEGRKRFCRDYNRPEGCPKSSPHSVWFGNGPGSTKRLVCHCCAACLIRDKTMRDHPEGHAECPHRA